jgi:hypothetical protein
MVPLDDGADGRPKNAATSESGLAAVALAELVGTAGPTAADMAAAGVPTLSRRAADSLPLVGRLAATVADGRGKPWTLAATPGRRLLELVTGLDPAVRSEVATERPALLTPPVDEVEPASSAAASPGAAASAAAMPAVAAPIRSH